MFFYGDTIIHGIQSMKTLMVGVLFETEYGRTIFMVCTSPNLVLFQTWAL